MLSLIMYVDLSLYGESSGFTSSHTMYYASGNRCDPASLLPLLTSMESITMFSIRHLLCIFFEEDYLDLLELS